MLSVWDPQGPQRAPRAMTVRRDVCRAPCHLPSHLIRTLEWGVVSPALEAEKLGLGGHCRTDMNQQMWGQTLRADLMPTAPWPLGPDSSDETIRAKAGLRMGGGHLTFRDPSSTQCRCPWREEGLLYKLLFQNKSGVSSCKVPRRDSSLQPPLAGPAFSSLWKRIPIVPVSPGLDSDYLAVLSDYPSPDISPPIFRRGEKLRVISEWVSFQKLLMLSGGMDAICRVELVRFQL